MRKEIGSFCSRNIRGKTVSSALSVEDKLGVIAGFKGPGKLPKKISEARTRLAKINSDRWRSPLAPGRIKRFLYGEQKPAYEEVDDIRAAYDKFLDEQYEHAKRVLAEIEYLRRTDEDFHREAIQQRVLLLQQISPLLFQAQQQSGRHPG